LSDDGPIALAAVFGRHRVAGHGAGGQLVAYSNRAYGQDFHCTIYGDRRAIGGVFLGVENPSSVFGAWAGVADDPGAFVVVGRGAGADFAGLRFIEYDDREGRDLFTRSGVEEVGAVVAFYCKCAAFYIGKFVIGQIIEY